MNYGKRSPNDAADVPLSARAATGAVASGRTAADSATARLVLEWHRLGAGALSAAVPARPAAALSGATGLLLGRGQGAVLL